MSIPSRLHTTPFHTSTSVIEPNSREELYKAALDISDSQKRDAILKGACGDDEALRARIHHRLMLNEASAVSSKDPIAESIPTYTCDYAVSTQPGTINAGKYKLLNIIGEGGIHKQVKWKPCRKSSFPIALWPYSPRLSMPVIKISHTSRRIRTLIH